MKNVFHRCNPMIVIAGLAGVVLATAVPCFAQYQRRAEGIGQLLDRLPHERTRVSAAVISLPDGNIVYQRNAEQVLIPASNMKIVAGAVGLAVLGVDYRFETRLEMQGQDLVIIGGGDPALGDRKLADERGHPPDHVFVRWARALAQQGTTVIRGDLIVDDRAFERRWVHPSWDEKDLPKWYAAPVGALNFNDNCIEITVRPGAAGQAVRYELFPETDWIKIENRCRTGTKNGAWIHRPSDEPLYELRGQCNRRAELQSVSVPDPGIFTGQVLKAVLQSHGVQVSGTVRRRRDGQRSGADVDSHTIATHATPIAAVLKRALRDSQNLFAECLLKAAGRAADAGQPPAPGAWQSGSQAALETVRRWGIDTTDMVVADGSGLSRGNRLSARQVVGILEHMYLDPKLGDRFIDSLSLNATHGTLRKRMKDIPGRVHAKTGYMRGVRPLSGYVTTTDGKWFAFSVIFNDIPGPTAPYNRLHDNICRVLVNPNSRPSN